MVGAGRDLHSHTPPGCCCKKGVSNPDHLAGEPSPPGPLPWGWGWGMPSRAAVDTSCSVCSLRPVLAEGK